MPGYILHLTAAKMAMDMLKESNWDSKMKNEFYIGSLLPDTVTDKTASHFRNPKHRGAMVEYPDLEMFLEKYEQLLENKSVLGYYFHLYIDRKFFKEYLPQVITFLDVEGNLVTQQKEVAWVQINRTKQRIPKEIFYSEAYYYGDYTRMNTYLVERYDLPLKLDVNVGNPGIEEVDYVDIVKVLNELCGYLKVPSSKVNELCVFDVGELLQFLEISVKGFFCLGEK